MSRKWERMVEKNRKEANRIRQKSGKKRLEDEIKQSAPTVRGRSWFFPLMLAGFSAFFGIAYSGVYHNDWAYWFTVVSYFLLALFIYFLRRPYIKIDKTTLITRRFSGDKRLEPNEITQIIFQKGYVIIEGQKKRGFRWVYSRLFHRYDMEQMMELLRHYSQKNNIKLDNQLK